MIMKKLKAIAKSRIFQYGLGLLFFVALWEIVAYATGLLFLPEFFQTFSLAFSKLGEELTYSALGYSFLRLFVALLGSGILGLVLGTLAGYYEPLGRVLSPTIAVLRAFPTIALILLLIVFVPQTAIWVVSLVLFPVLYQASLSGSRRVYKDYEMILRLKGKNNLSNITRIILPLSMDYVLLGWTQSMGLGLKIVIMAETFTFRTNQLGIGNLINSSYQNLNYPDMMAYVLISLLVILLLDFLLHFAKKTLQGKKKEE